MSNWQYCLRFTYFRVCIWTWIFDVWVVTVGGVRVRGGLADLLSQPEPRSSGPAALGFARASTAAATIIPACLGQIRALSGMGGIPDPPQCLCGFP